MDSRQQEDMGVAKKLIKSLVVLLIGICIIGGLNSNFNKLRGEKVTTCMNFNEELSRDQTTILAKAMSDSTANEKIIIKNIVIGDKVENTFLVNKENTNINNFNVQINGFAISIQDNTFGYVTAYEQRKEILNDVCKRYIDEIGLKLDDISTIEVSGSIQATQSKVNISQLSNSGEISEEIYNASVIDNELLGLKMTVKLSEKEIVEPEILVISDEELYMGEMEVDEGTIGSKLVFKEVVYEGVSQVDEMVISEELLINSTPTIIRKGAKNPYFDGVAFLARPTDGGYLSSLFGEYRASSYHKGIDYAKNTGEDVMAAFDGTVISSGYNDGGYGNLIIIEHENDMKTYYAHLNDIYVSEGDLIEKGEVIGTIGNTGFSTGPHLHFELRVNDEPVNPVNYIVE